jgi:hypothetical protein
MRTSTAFPCHRSFLLPLELVLERADAFGKITSKKRQIRIELCVRLVCGQRSQLLAYLRRYWKEGFLKDTTYTSLATGGKT